MQLISFARSRSLAACAVALGAALAAASGAQAGEYTLVQCDPASPDHGAARFDRTDGAYYGFARGCTDPDQARSLKIGSLASAPTGAEGRIAWSAPAGTRVVGVSAEARLRRDGGHRARLSFLDAAGRQAGRIATGRDEPGGFERFRARLDGTGRAGFAAHLICIDDAGCSRSEQARTWIRSVRLTLHDSAPPSVAAFGALLAGGWQRGSRSLGVRAGDVGGGLRDVGVTVGGSRVSPGRTLDCSLVAGGLAPVPRPCPARYGGTATLETDQPPFADGPNRLTICARDYGSDPNQRCLARTVMVDNEPPAARFLRRDPADPELIAAEVSDRHSGPASIRIAYRRIDGGGGPWREAAVERTADGARARIDSRSVPAGRYLLRLTVVDRAGNRTVTSRRAGGGRMVLDFPLLERTVLSARPTASGHRLSYGERPRVRGRLRVAGGGPLPGRELRVVESFEPGSLPMRRERVVRTDRRGRYSVRLGRGPSRRVEVAFDGDRRYLASRARPRKVAVSGRAGLRLSARRVEAGGRVRFRGRVGSRGARIPAPGKVVELQVRERGQRRFRTVGDALHTDPRGRVRSSYRFGRFYRRPARFQFRLKVTRQARWPYRAPIHSRPRPLKVMPR